jgi:hypothetical protein
MGLGHFRQSGGGRLLGMELTSFDGSIAALTVTDMSRRRAVMGLDGLSSRAETVLLSIIRPYAGISSLAASSQP